MRVCDRTRGNVVVFVIPRNETRTPLAQIVRPKEIIFLQFGKEEDLKKRAGYRVHILRFRAWRRQGRAKVPAVSITANFHTRTTGLRLIMTLSPMIKKPRYSTQRFRRYPKTEVPPFVFRSLREFYQNSPKCKLNRFPQLAYLGSSDLIPRAFYEMTA